MSNPWNYPLREGEKQLALFTKRHFQDPECSETEAARTIYAARSGGVPAPDESLLRNFLHPTLLKMIGPHEFAGRMGDRFADYLRWDNSDLHASSVIEVYLSMIRMTDVKFSERPEWMSEEETLPLLSNAEAEVIDVEDRETLYPKHYEKNGS